MTRGELVSVCVEIAEALREEIVPKDTGNMAYKAVQYRIEGDTFHLWVDSAIAPYVPYTNEEWKSPKWKGKKNPNEGWWNRLCEEFINRLATRLGGRVE